MNDLNQQKAVFPNNDSCPVRDVLTHLTGKWPMLVLFALLDGPERFLELQRRIEGISRRMLTVTLRDLERNGFVARTVYPESPPRVEYNLTEMGHSVVKPLIDLIGWAGHNHDKIRSCRLSYDQSQT